MLYILLIAISSLYVGKLATPFVYYLPKITRLWLKQDLIDLTNDPDVELNEADYNVPVFRYECDHCHQVFQKQKFWNLAVFHLIFNGGLCKNCGQCISPKYGVIELAFAGTTFLVLVNSGISYLSLPVLLFFYLLTLLAFVDYDSYIVPAFVVTPLIWGGLSLPIFHLSPLTSTEAVTGAIVGYISLWLLSLLAGFMSNSKQLGGGDLKLMMACGAWFGVKLIPLALVSMFVLAAVAMIVSKAQRNKIAFVPFMVMGWAISLCCGNGVMDWYIQHFIN